MLKELLMSCLKGNTSLSFLCMIHVAGQPTYFLKTKEIARVVMEHFVGVSSSDRGALDQGDF